MNKDKQTILTILSKEEETLLLGMQLAQSIKQGAIIYLEGPLGAGKTTFARGFLRGFGYTDKVKSPTYTIVEPYEVNEHSIFHFDLYRLKDANELQCIGIQDYFFPQAICLIEWAEKGVPYLPQSDLTCYLTFKEQGREIRIEANTSGGEEILRRFRQE